jgi:hypothetical protein
MDFQLYLPPCDGLVQRWRYEMLGISWTLPCQLAENLPASDALGITLKSQYFIPRVVSS